MKIGVIGAGHVGGTLGVRWARQGHSVVLSTRDLHSGRLREILRQAGPGARAAGPQETVMACDILLLATPFPAAREAIATLGNLVDKILIDATNPILSDLSGLSMGTTISAAEQIAVWARGAKVVKAFNTVGYNILENPAFPDGQPAMFYCGDDAAAKQPVAQLATEMGFDALDAGPLRQARLLEPMALLWISLALSQGHGRDIALQLLRR